MPSLGTEEHSNSRQAGTADHRTEQWYRNSQERKKSHFVVYLKLIYKYCCYYTDSIELSHVSGEDLPPDMLNMVWCQLNFTQKLDGKALSTIFLEKQN